MTGVTGAAGAGAAAGVAPYPRSCRQVSLAWVVRDAAEGMITLARRLVPEGDFRLGALEELPWEHAVFDVVTAFNSMQFAYELQKANKPFQMMLYPRSRHGLTDPQLIRHSRQLMLDFTIQALRPSPPVF